MGSNPTLASAWWSSGRTPPLLFTRVSSNSIDTGLSIRGHMSKVGAAPITRAFSYRRLAQQLRHLPYTQRFGGASPSATTILLLSSSKVEQGAVNTTVARASRA